jgi:hypothetical protein
LRRWQGRSSSTRTIIIPNRDGSIPELDNESKTTSELLQAHLPTSKVVKAFNHIYASALTTDDHPPARRTVVRWQSPETIRLRKRPSRN